MGGNHKVGSISGFMKKNKLFIRLEITFVLITVLPILLFGIWAVTNTSFLLEKHFTDRNLESSIQIEKSFETILENITNLSEQVFYNKQLEALLKINLITDPFDKKELINIVKNIESSSSFIDNVYLYLPKSDSVVTSIRGYEPIGEFADTFFLDWYENSDKNYVVSETRYTSYGDNESNQYRMFSVMTRIPLDKREAYYGAIIINIDQSILGDLLPIGEDDFYVVSDEGRILFSSKNEFVDNFIFDYDYLQIDFLQKRGSYLSGSKNNKVLTTYNLLSSKDWYFLTTHPYAAEENTKGIMVNWLWVIGALMVFLSTIMAAFFAKHNINPLRVLRDYIPERYKEEGINQKAGNSIPDLVSEVIAYQTRLENQLKKTLGAYKEINYLDLIRKGKVHDKNFSFPFSEEQLYLVILEIDHYDALISEAGYEDSTYKLRLLLHIQEELLEEVRGFCLEVELNRLAVVISAFDIDTQRLYEKLVQLQQRLVEDELFNSIAFYDTVIKSNELKSAYDKCFEMLYYKFSYGNNHIIKGSELNHKITNEFELFKYPEEQLEFLISYTVAEEKMNALNLLHKILDDLDKNRTYLFRQHVLFSMLKELMKLPDKFVEESEVIKEESKNLLKEITVFNSARAMEASFTRIIEEIITTLQNKKKLRMNDYVDQILAFLREHYIDQITLNDVCEIIHLSPTYVCKILKQYTGKTFIQILNEIRIAEACKLLKEQQDKKVMEIAEKCGFTNSRYFIKVFKDLMQITPGEYREL